MKKRFDSSPTTRVSIDELIKSKTSMLGDGRVPVEYATLETDYDVRDHVFTAQEDKRVVRMQIVWDLPASALDEIEMVLEHMRERGAAMIRDAEEVKQ